ncbi:hypothetical protein A2U01_0014276 [Trifolium medium]|uniref:Uncharacterized protein n=1 Tax=Trifolium medium TaxID=97028 RepID=A0A392N0L5_9FABA|nr:hypothetical protein [Trifolium medium]
MNDTDIEIDPRPYVTFPLTPDESVLLRIQSTITNRKPDRGMGGAEAEVCPHRTTIIRSTSGQRSRETANQVRAADNEGVATRNSEEAAVVGGDGWDGGG